MKTYLITVVLLASPFVALQAQTSAEENEQPTQLVQEVFQTELVYPQDQGEVQLTARSIWNDEREGRSTEGSLAVEYGLTDAWQLEMAVPGVDLRPDGGDSSSGLGDLEVGTKYAFMNIGGSHLHAAVGVDVTLPTGDPDRGLGEGLLGVEPYLSLGRDLPEWNNAHVFGQVGLGLVRRSRSSDEGDDAAPAHELSFNTGLVVPVGNARLIGGLNWSSNKWNHDGDESSLFVTPGVVWDLPGTWEAGVGVPIGLTDSSDRYRVVGQLIWEFGGDDH